MSRNGNPEDLEAEVLRHMPADVMHALQRSDRREPVVKHLVQSSITRFVTDIDKRTLEAPTAKIMAGTAAVKAATEARRAVNELSRVDEDLAQEAELHDLRHETARLTEQDKQKQLRFRVVRRQRVAATLKAQRDWLERELDAKDSSRPNAADKWEALLQTFRGNVTGVADFQSQTDLWLDEYRETRRATVQVDDPRRAEKLARIDALVEELSSLRDRMMRDGWLPQPK